jgi:hypothetical protein
MIVDSSLDVTGTWRSAMTLLDRLRRLPPDGEIGLLDLDRTISDAAAPQGRRRAVAQLRRERKQLVKRRKALEKGFRRLSRMRTALITRSSASLEMQVYQFSQGLRAANEADASGTQLKEDLTAIENRIQSIDEAITNIEGSSG